MTDRIVLDWTGAAALDLRSVKKVLGAAGLASRSGDAHREFQELWHVLRREQGFGKGDLLEATYRGRMKNGAWLPEPYAPEDCETSIADLVRATRQLLRWYASRLPAETEWHLVGYSLGGVTLFEAAAELLEQEAAHWRGKIRSVITFSAPLLGSDLGEESSFFGLFSLDTLVPGGAVGRELLARWRDPGHRPRTLRRADFLRSQGVELLTLADEYDVVVTPKEAVLAPPSEQDRYVFTTSRALVGGRHADNVLGHGPLLSNHRALELAASVIGPQQRRGGG